MENINGVVVRLFVATDQRNWRAVEQCFAPKVTVDFSSMNGSPASLLTRQELVQSWKAVLPGFESTHHQLGNFITTAKSDSAHVFCYVTASHYLPHEDGSLWTVVGSYDFDLTKNRSRQWEITKMAFNFKYQAGNTDLPALI